MKKIAFILASLFIAGTLLFTSCTNSTTPNENTPPAGEDTTPPSGGETTPPNEDQDQYDDTLPDKNTGLKTPPRGNQIDPEVITENPTIGDRETALNFIFNNQTLGKTTIKIRRSEWNLMCEDYRYFFKNENCVKGISYTYEKDGEKWVIPNIGFRLRGSTSRYVPQGKDNGRQQGQMNADWQDDYYNYAENCDDDDYRQAHFKVDFEEWLPDGQEFKMAGCMKGVALKRMDGACGREIMCYDLFHKYGIWTAPRASHTKLTFEFVEDVDSDGNVINDATSLPVTKYEYGVYEMFEEVGKQSLKARDKDNNKETQFTNFWKNNKGNLWKICGGGSLKPESLEGEGRCGVEEIAIIYNSKGERIDKVWHQYNYDLKTNKTSFASAKAELRGFTQELAALPKTADTEADQNKIKAFYEKWFDMDFFLKTYAINILVGMDDDYWANNNNYYFYIGADKDGNKKAWFIPFDYDNTLGASIKRQADHGGTGDGLFQNPLDWGRGKDSPLMDRMLLVPEYKAKFVNYLKEVSSEDNYWNTTTLKNTFSYWQNTLVRPHMHPKKPNGDYYLDDHISAVWPYDGCWNPDGYYLTSDPNIFDATRQSILRWIGDFNTITFNLNGGNIDGNTNSIVVDVNDSNKNKTLSELYATTPKKDDVIFMGWTATKDGEDYTTLASANTVYARWKALNEITDPYFIYEKANDEDGITIGILNISSDVYVREIFINGIKVGQTEATGDSEWNTNTKLPVVQSNEWVYPYTEANKNYEIYIVYRNKGWGEIARTNTITIKAKGGKGEFKATTPPVYTVENNVFKFTTKPVLQIGDKTITCPATTPENWKNEWNECYIWDIKKKGWGGDVSWNKLDPSLPDLNLLTAKNHNDDPIIPDDCRNMDLMFQLYFKYTTDSIEEYWLILYDFETKYFKVVTN